MRRRIICVRSKPYCSDRHRGGDWGQGSSVGVSSGCGSGKDGDEGLEAEHDDLCWVWCGEELDV